MLIYNPIVQRASDKTPAAIQIASDISGFEHDSHWDAIF
jgi:hypothetical protein